MLQNRAANPFLKVPMVWYCLLRILHFQNAVFVQCEPFHAFTKEDRQRKTMLLKNIVNRTKKVNELSLLDQEDEYISCTQTRRFTDKSCQP